VAKFLIIGPFLYVVGFFDFLIGLVLPYKYDDDSLPDKNATLSRLSNKNDPGSPWRSTMAPELVRIDNKNTNIYKEFAAAAKKYWYNQTLGQREILSIDDEVRTQLKVEFADTTSTNSILV